MTPSTAPLSTGSPPSSRRSATRASLASRSIPPGSDPSESDSLAWRSFGGPQAAVQGGADEATRSCLTESHATSARFVSLRSRRSTTVRTATLAAPPANEAQTVVTLACPSLSSLIAVDPADFIDRAALQADCIAATVHGNAAELGLDCGPSNARFDVTRGEWTQVIVDQEEWGSVCGDGSDYAFWIRPAPEGAPLENVLIGLQGGGVCVFEDDCVPRFESSPGLFTAMDDEPYSLASSLMTQPSAPSPTGRRSTFRAVGRVRRRWCRRGDSPCRGLAA